MSRPPLGRIPERRISRRWRIDGDRNGCADCCTQLAHRLAPFLRRAVAESGASGFTKEMSAWRPGAGGGTLRGLLDELGRTALERAARRARPAGRSRRSSAGSSTLSEAATRRPGRAHRTACRRRHAARRPERRQSAGALADGAQVIVPRWLAPGTAAAGTAAAAPGGKVTLGTATLEQLDELPGVGPVTTELSLSPTASLAAVELSRIRGSQSQTVGSWSYLGWCRRPGGSGGPSRLGCFGVESGAITLDVAARSLMRTEVELR